MKRRIRTAVTLALVLTLAGFAFFIARPPEQTWIEPEWTKQFTPSKVREPRIVDLPQGRGRQATAVVSRGTIWQINRPFEQVRKALDTELTRAGWSRMVTRGPGVQTWYKRLPNESGSLSIQGSSRGTWISSSSSRSLTWLERANRSIRRLFGVDRHPTGSHGLGWREAKVQARLSE